MRVTLVVTKCRKFHEARKTPSIFQAAGPRALLVFGTETCEVPISHSRMLRSARRLSPSRIASQTIALRTMSASAPKRAAGSKETTGDSSVGPMCEFLGYIDSLIPYTCIDNV